MDRDRQLQLLKIARTSIRTAFLKKPVEVPPCEEQLGSFVTLKEQGQLRGCIGYLLPLYPLNEQIAVLAREAAFQDYRFSPLQEAELDLCSIEISLLSLPVPIQSPEEFEPGEHGIILTYGKHRSVFLPQVAQETGWDRIQMLDALSSKAGLPAQAWKSPQATFEIFVAEVFSE